MSVPSLDIIEDLESRNLLMQVAGGDQLQQHLATASRTIYCGFDPTAESLHVGSMVPLLVLRRCQLAGHKPIALIGGATGLIGDPSFKDNERNLNSEAVVAAWVERLKPQLGQFLDFDCGDNSAVLANNLDWIQHYSVLGFLRDIGKHFSVNAMIRKESVKQRIEREGAGISFTEFSYILLQSCDFAELYRRYHCTVQIGGSDQWGNITGGIDLTRRLHQVQVYGATTPLVTRADGTKFGKTESGTVWISPQLTSPYAFYQFWLNVADVDVYNYLRLFTFISLEEIGEIKRSDQTARGRPEAQGILAAEVTELVHGKSGLQAAQRISMALFSGAIAALSAADLQQLELDGMPCTRITGTSISIVQALVDTELAKSNRMAREFISNHAVSANGQVINDVASTLLAADALHARYFILRRGKKRFHLLKLVDF